MNLIFNVRINFLPLLFKSFFSFSCFNLLISSCGKAKVLIIASIILEIIVEYNI